MNQIYPLIPIVPNIVLDSSARESGITRKEFQRFYLEEYYKIIGRERAADILRILDTAGLIVEQPDRARP